MYNETIRNHFFYNDIKNVWRKQILKANIMIFNITNSNKHRFIEVNKYYDL